MNDSKLRKKYKQLKYQHLKKIYDKKLSKLPQNCKYNKEIAFKNAKINICSYDMEDNSSVDLCYKPHHAQDCNAFCPRKSKEKLHLDFVEELKDDQTRATKYKDINLIYWMNPELEFEEFPQKRRWYHSVFSWFKNLFS
jgi:hypothetical protein